MLRKNFFTAEQIIALANDYHQAGLEPGEVALMDYAYQVARDAGQTTAAHFETLRSHGYSETDIVNITLAAAARCYFSKALDALGAEPDESYRSLEPELVQALVRGRPY